MFSCEFCEVSKNTFVTEHLWTTAFKKKAVGDSLEVFALNICSLFH